jgi:glutamate 5-kinase
MLGGRQFGSELLYCCAMKVVVKVGTSLIAPGGRIATEWMRALVDQLDLVQHEYLIVSSGAIACGMAGLGLRTKPSEVQQMQACAAVGQSALMHTYEQLFYGKKKVAQLLLTSDDFSSPARYRNLCNTLSHLLRLSVIPVVNENDSVSVRELVGSFGDNDELSALLALAVRADWLLLLTNVDGFYLQGNGGGKKIVRTVRRFTPALEDACKGKSKLGTGGMASKLRAARLAVSAGVHVVIANGTKPGVIRQAFDRRTGTYFPPQLGKNGAGYLDGIQILSRFADR